MNQLPIRQKHLQMNQLPKRPQKQMLRLNPETT
jgi:hypothetical protein